MDEQEYLKRIEQIRERIRNNQLFSVMEQLDELSEIRPVRLKWIIAKAEAMLALGYPIEELYSFLQDKGWNLYDYPDVKAYYELYIKLAELLQDESEIERNKNSISFGEINDYKNITGFLEAENTENAQALLNSYYCLDDPVMYLLLYLYLDKKGIAPAARTVFMDFWNSGFIKEVVSAEMDIPFLLISDAGSTGVNCEVLARILNYFGKQVYWIGMPICFEVDNNVRLEDTVSVSMENCEHRGRGVLYHPVELKRGEECLGDNRDYLIKQLEQQLGENKGFMVFTSGWLLDQFCAQPVLQKSSQRISSFRSPANENEMAFGWCGSCFPYLDIIHCMNTKAELSKDAECEFSIVIPARNSVETLRCTIETCLNQRFKGNYEIVLSDNSSIGNMEIYNLYKTFDSHIIKYYRTPREYNLSKSFEFAILHARGEFIIPIGSDDGILPWALEYLQKLRTAYPEEEIIGWDRGFYAWPGFNGGQQNQFIIPRSYEKDQLAVYYWRTEYLLKLVMQSPNYMYLLPMLYINSGFKRTYLKRLIEETGALWDGVSQDTYIAAVNCLLMDRFLYACYPITIAGMSSRSIGAQSATARQTVEEDMKYQKEVSRTGNIGGFTMSAMERLLPMTGRDITCFYSSLLRCVAKGLVSFEELDAVLDWKNMFYQAVEGISLLDIQYDRMLHYCRYTASLHGLDFLKWFDAEIYSKGLSPVLITNQQYDNLKDQKTYKEEKTEEGGRVCDASKYGVTDIYGAVKLFERLSGL